VLKTSPGAILAISIVCGHNQLLPPSPCRNAGRGSFKRTHRPPEKIGCKVSLAENSSAPSKSSAPSRWEYVFDSVLLVLFVLPSLVWTAAGVLCSNALSIGDPPVCVIPAFAPLVTLVQYFIGFNLLLGGGLVTFPLIVIAYVVSSARKRRRMREYGVQQAFAQHRFGFIVWVAATVMLVFVCVVSVVAIVDVVRALFDLGRAFLNSNN
jgi:hypothetical protein